MSDANTLAPTDVENFLAQIDELVAQAREDDRLCYDQIPSQRYADARERIVSAVLAKWGAPAPASHPYAYEFSRRNEDGTHSLHIERNELQEGVLRWWERIGPPKDAITDRPIKALYETPQAHPVAAPEPHYGNGRYLGFARHNDAYSVAQVQAMFAAKTQPTTK